MISQGVFQKSFRIPKYIASKQLVSSGSLVNAGDVLWSEEKKGKLFSLDIARYFQKSPSEAIKLLKKKVGNKVKQGEILAYKNSLISFFAEKLCAPSDGIIEAINEQTALVLLRAESSFLEYASPVSGTVLHKNGELIIEASGVKIQGAYGVGSMQFGSFIWADDFFNEKPLTGTYVLGVSVFSEKMLEQILSAKDRIAGVIAAGLPLRSVRVLEAHGVSVILTEGVGEISMSKLLVEIFSQCCQKAVSLFPETKVYAGAIRPVIFSPNFLKLDGYSNEQVLRCLRAPYLGVYLEKGANSPFTVGTSKEIALISQNISKVFE